jgi:hypothetical protein
VNSWDHKCTEKGQIFCNCKSGWQETRVLLFWIPVKRKRKARLPDCHVAHNIDAHCVLQYWYISFFFGVLWMKILKNCDLFPRFVMLNLITLSHLSDTGQAERTVLCYTILWDLYESAYFIDTIKIKYSPPDSFLTWS